MTKTLETSQEELTSGTTLSGRYQIIEELGRGGMGRVYRAEDTSLSRPVAIKVLPEEFASDPERLARFEREAKLLAVLNHPNIAAIHGIEESGGRRFLILELAEGETLRDRLEKGRLPVDEALETCKQIAEGLEAAHEKGIIHRDLKPGNIMISPKGKVKILDFGLAKAFSGETSGFDIEKSPTITAQMTEPGVILGTAAYMSPEQARSRPVDKKTDIWSFGCVLYECLTGARAFHGQTVSDTLAHILKGEPDWDKLPSDTPSAIKTLLRRCLENDPKKRLHDIADARIEIETREANPPEEEPARRRFSLPLLGVGAAVFLLAGILIDRVFISHSPSAVARSLISSTIKIESGYQLAGIALEMERPSRTAMAISNDGRFIVFSAIEKDEPLRRIVGPQAAKPRLFLRHMDRLEAKPIGGTDGGINPFLSPDNRWVGFWADNKLKKVPIEGGVPSDLCDTSPLIFGANWGRNHIIVFTDGGRSGISKVPAEGGKPEILTRPDPNLEETSHRLPTWLPNGKAVLFTVMKHGWDTHPRIALLRLDTGEWRYLMDDAADVRYVSTGHLVFLSRGKLMAVRFDLAKMEVTGQPVPIIANVMQAFSTGAWYHTGAGQFAISDSGTLIYASGGIIRDLENSLVWVDQRGTEQPVTDKRFSYFAPRLSPDGQRIAYSMMGIERQIFVLDLVRGTNSPLVSEGRSVYPIWTHDGKRLIFAWHRSLVQNLFWQPFDGSSPMARLTTSPHVQRPGSCSPDGKTLAFVEYSTDLNADIVMLDIPSGRVTPFLNSPFSEQYPDFSWDGRWLAYTSDESKRNEIYVREFPDPGAKLQVSTEGGEEALWAKDGKRLFYRWEDQVWVVDVLASGVFSKPRLLFRNPGYSQGVPTRTYDLSSERDRFLMVKEEQMKPEPVTEMILVQNWFEELKRLVPTGK